MPGRTSRQELTWSVTRMEPAPPAHSPACMDATIQCSPLISCLLSHLKCWALPQTEWILLSNQRFTSFQYQISSLRICSLGSGLYLNPQLLLLIQQTFVECLPLEPGLVAKFRKIWFLPSRNLEEGTVYYIRLTTVSLLT